VTLGSESLSNQGAGLDWLTGGARPLTPLSGRRAEFSRSRDDLVNLLITNLIIILINYE
jgi:hypothetical protein